MTETINRNQILKIFKALCVTVFVLFILGYTGYEIKKMVLGPTIQIASPINGATVSESLLEIIGTAGNIKEIKLNDKKFFIDEKGNFKEKVLLSYGYNVVTIKAEDRFGKEKVESLELIYK